MKNDEKIICYWCDEDKVYIAEHPCGVKTHGDSEEEALNEMFFVLSFIEEIEKQITIKNED